MSLTLSELVRTNSCFILNKWSLVKRMLPTTMLVDITPLARKSLTKSWTESENYRTTVLDSRVSWSSIHLAEELVPVSPPCSWNGFLLTMERRPNWNSPFTQLQESPQLSSNHIMPFWRLIQLWSTPIVHLWSTMRQFMISAPKNLVLKDQLTPTWTDWSRKLCLPSLVSTFFGFMDHKLWVSKIFFSFIAIWWCIECGFEWIPDQLGSLSKNSFPSCHLRTNHLCRAGIPRANVRSWVDQCLFRKWESIGQMWSTNGQVHGMLPLVAWRCCSKGCQCCYCIH